MTTVIAPGLRDRARLQPLKALGARVGPRVFMVYYPSASFKRGGIYELLERAHNVMKFIVYQRIGTTLVRLTSPRSTTGGRNAGKSKVLFFKTLRRRFSGLWWSVDRRSGGRSNSRRTNLSRVTQLAGHDVSQRLQRNGACDRVVAIP